MLVLGLYGSPRKKGNTSFLLSTFLEEAERLGARTRLIDTGKRNILPCRELTVCEKKGVCPIKDDMEAEIYALIREADVIVAATPIFFYNMSAQLKALVDRCQMFWARKYLMKLKDPGADMRRGFLMSAAATKGKNLFYATELSIKYFFDAVAAKYHGALNYRGIESKGDMAKHPTAVDEVRAAVAEIMAPFQGRKRVLFACRENACRSQMAAAFARYGAGKRIDALSAGSEPAEKPNEDMLAAMAEKGMDLDYHPTRHLDDVLEVFKPEVVVTMGCKEKCPVIPGVRYIDWDLPDPAGQPVHVMGKVRDDIEKRVAKLIDEL